MVELLNREPARLSPVFDEAGKAVPIESFRGKTVILNLWAPWCVPCLKEMPSLDRLAARLPENGLRRRRGDEGPGRPLAVEDDCSTGWGSSA